MFDSLAPREKQLARLGEVCEELARFHKELGFLLAEEARARVQGFLASPETSVSGRERDASVHALESVCAIYDVKSQMGALNEEKDFLRVMLDAV